jgi:hypothetical protein
MLIKLGDGTEVEVEAERDEIQLRVRPSGSWPWGADARLDVSSCEELMRGLEMKIKEARDW